MKFSRLVDLTADLHCFSPGILAAGEDVAQVRVQISRWVQSGGVTRIHKGWYTLNDPYRRVRLDAHVVASTIKAGSYVSLQSALAFHGMIPEDVVEMTCVTSGRPLFIDSPVGRFHFRHIKRDAFFGYSRYEYGVQHAHIAEPEKALLDLMYLTPGSNTGEYLAELRLQETEKLDLEKLRRMAARFGTPRLVRAVQKLAVMVASERGGA